MKRYIKASLSESTPDWLIGDLKRKWGSDLKQDLMKKYRIALDRVTYSDEPTGNSIPIYLLKTDFGNTIYCPKVNDDSTAYINGRNRKLGSIAKSRLPEMIEDVVYIDLSDKNNVFERKERYQDPRYTYRNSAQGRYAGQYKKQNYNYDTGEYDRGEWTKSGMTPSNESRARDKSGYKIPSPEEKLAQYYKKFPEKIQNKIDTVYNKLLDTKQLLMDADFNVPQTSWRDSTEQSRVDYGRAYRRFADAVDEYRKLLSDAKDFDPKDRYSLSRFANSVQNVSDRVDEVRKMLAGEDVW